MGHYRSETTVEKCPESYVLGRVGRHGGGTGTRGLPPFLQMRRNSQNYSYFPPGPSPLVASFVIITQKVG